MQLEIKSLSSINDTARQFIAQMNGRKVFAFNGEMGAGKTTFIKAICEELGVIDSVNSPTFAIVNEYAAGNGEPIYHFDCYRLKNVQEALNLGAEEYLYSDHICFIEWAENMAEILPDHLVQVDISVNAPTGKRNILIHS